MSNKHFMLDIESTGVTKEDHLLEIGLVEVDFKDGFWHPGKSYQTYQGYNGHPTSAFAREHMQDIYTKCNNITYRRPEVIRDEIVAFCTDCGVDSLVKMMGWNASTFDVPFLTDRDYLIRSHYIQDPNDPTKETLVGDVHYRVYEMSGAIQVATDVLGIERGELKEKVLAAAPNLFDSPVGKQHDAIFDCYKQIDYLNGIIALLRG